MSDEDMVDRKNINEEHRKYLDIKDNPETVGTAAVFSLLSDGLTEIKVAMGKMETKQNIDSKIIGNLDGKVTKLDEKFDKKITVLEDDFIKCRVDGQGFRGMSDERVIWIMRAIGLIIVMLSVTISLFFAHIGWPVPLP